MASNVVSPSVEQCFIIKLLVKEKVKPAGILCSLNAQHGKETLLCGVSMNDAVRFPKAVKKS
jgi:hypothetical protein